MGSLAQFELATEQRNPEAAEAAAREALQKVRMGSGAVRIGDGAAEPGGGRSGGERSAAKGEDGIWRRFELANEQRNPEASEAAAREALQMDATRVDAYLALADVYESRGQLAEFDGLLAEADAAVPDDWTRVTGQR